MTATGKKRPDAGRPAGRHAEETAKAEALIGRRLSLTPAETRVAAALIDGLSYAEIAERLGVSYHTVHTHVKSIHVKAGVGTNARLLALLRRMQEG